MGTSIDSPNGAKAVVIRPPRRNSIPRLVHGRSAGH
jgi:hypothetical protein